MQHTRQSDDLLDVSNGAEGEENPEEEEETGRQQPAL